MSITSLMNSWADACERSAARIRARTALRSRIIDEVAHEMVATLHIDDDLRLVMKVVIAETNRRYRRALKAGA